MRVRSRHGSERSVRSGRWSSEVALLRLARAAHRAVDVGTGWDVEVHDGRRARQRALQKRLGVAAGEVLRGGPLRSPKLR